MLWEVIKIVNILHYFIYFFFSLQKTQFFPTNGLRWKQRKTAFKVKTTIVFFKVAGHNSHAKFEANLFLNNLGY